MVSDSSTIAHIHTRARAHTHTYTHTHARRRADAHSWRAGVCRAGGVVGPWQFRAGAGGKESTRAPPDEPGCSGEKPAASATGRRGTSRAPNSGARPITSAASASFYSQRGLPFPGCLALNPHFAPLGRPPSSPRRAPLRASGGPAHFPGAAETPPPAAAAGRSGSSSPLSPAAAAAAAGASRAALMYYSLGWPGRFLESPRRRCEVFGGRLLVQRSQFLGNWGVLRGRRNAFFHCFPAEGGGFFARSSQERAAPRAQEGACQSRRVRWAAPLAARVAGRLGRDALEAWRARQDRALFLDTTPSLPTRSSRGSRSAGPGNPPRPGPPTELLLPSPLLLHLAPAPTFRSTPTQTHTHTRTLKTSPPSTSAPLPRVV